MRNAPAVNYPVGRSHFQGGLLLGLGLLSGGVCLYWLLSGGWRWPYPLAALAWLLAAVTAGCAWWQPPRGQLCWDGQTWSRTDAAGAAVPGRVLPRLDLQSRLLLEFQAHTGPVHWLWLERGLAAHRWDALRRALHTGPALVAVDGGAARS